MKKFAVLSLCATLLAVACSCHDCGEATFSVNPELLYLNYSGNVSTTEQIGIASSNPWTANYDADKLILSQASGQGGRSNVAISLTSAFMAQFAANIDSYIYDAAHEGYFISTVHFTSDDGQTDKVDVYYKIGVGLEASEIVLEDKAHEATLRFSKSLNIGAYSAAGAVDFSYAFTASATLGGIVDAFKQSNTTYSLYSAASLLAETEGTADVSSGRTVLPVLFYLDQLNLSNAAFVQYIRQHWNDENETIGNCSITVTDGNGIRMTKDYPVYLKGRLIVLDSKADIDDPNLASVENVALNMYGYIPVPAPLYLSHSYAGTATIKYNDLSIGTLAHPTTISGKWFTVRGGHFLLNDLFGNDNVWNWQQLPELHKQHSVCFSILNFVNEVLKQYDNSCFGHGYCKIVWATPLELGTITYTDICGHKANVKVLLNLSSKDFFDRDSSSDLAQYIMANTGKN